ncbi:hypothetical protein [Paenibacillus radicis (ex Gao et al. 2016)]|uniref:Uncharacterized protein n=1 Tax=Paenibacillus radicis (ex Gao et al. 2016) TaxID=1737354 RepID=A0A917M7V0_9BACL|nr:hypothetical protein [Paenibacillus radicis (ex Gao et al. 2016)]GGG84744.1 hypothetical protein GCM10010918_48260 [Paenibacillus radicis (ex Gao et al. 2016)]
MSNAHSTIFLASAAIERKQAVINNGRDGHFIVRGMTAVVVFRKVYRVTRKNCFINKENKKNGDKVVTNPSSDLHQRASEDNI